MATRDGLSFALRCTLENLPAPVSEYVFAIHEGRHWRFDYAWPADRVALEVEGGMFARGQHVRAAGIRRDMEKYNTAAVQGWIVVRCLPETLTHYTTFAFLHRAFTYRLAVAVALHP